jgi:CRISPR-associated endonuclease/helicase Cas3
MPNNGGFLIVSDKDKKYLAHKKENKEQSVEEHLNAVSEYAKEFAGRINLKKCGEIGGLIHDMGKYSDEFQARITQGANITDHATFGAKYLYDLFEKCFTVNKENMAIRTIFEMICLASMSHHGGLIDVVEIGGVNNFTRRLNKIEETQCKLLEERSGEIKNKLAESINSEAFKSECKNIREKLKIFTGEKSADKDEAVLFFDALLIKYIYSCLIDADRIDTAEFYDGKFPPAPVEKWDKIIEASDSKNKNFEINEINKIRGEIFDTCVEYGKKEKGFYKLAVPTGGGKTLSSFRFAAEHAKTHKLDRIIYIVPYISIIEQNAEVIKDMLVKNGINGDILIESHSNLTIDKDKDIL